MIRLREKLTSEWKYHHQTILYYSFIISHY